MIQPRSAPVIAGAALAAALAACSPTLDWREFVPEGSAIAVTFPCRPDRHARPVALGGARLRMELLVCDAGGATYALGFVDVADPASIGATLADWRTTAAANIQAGTAPLAPWPLRGATPNQQAGRVTLDGRLPDGAPVREHAAFFVRGLRVYAATVIGAQPSAAAVEIFFGGLKFPA